MQDVYRIEPKKIHFDKPMLKLIIQYGLPSGLQNSIIGFANVVVQTNINAFGQMAMAGCGAFSKIEGFGFLPITSFTMALTTFVGQNLGARELERTRKGARFGILCSVAIAEGIGILIFIGAPWLIAAFNRDPQVIAYGTDRGADVRFVFLPAGIFSLYGGNPARGWEIDCSDAGHAADLVRGAGNVYHADGSLGQFDSSCFLGISADLADEFSYFLLLLSARRLDACI